MKTSHFFRTLVSLSISVIFLLSFSQNLFSQTKDTLWTRDVWPLYVINGVFSPDDQFIYATGASDSYGKPPHHLMKYDLQGNQLEINDTIPGLKQYSHDGLYFWDINGNKYDAQTFKRLQKFADGKFNISGWGWEINTKADIGVGSREGIWTQTQSRRYYDSNLIIFRPSDMEVLKYTSYPGKIFEFISQSIHPDGQLTVFFISSLAIDYKGNEYTDAAKIEIWDIKEFKKIKEIQIQIPNNFDNIKLKYSPDGSVLGYQHDGNLTLYSTSDYSVIWESDFGIIMNFGWSSDTKYFYINSFPTNFGLSKYTFPEMKKIYLYPKFESTEFINFNKDNSLILCSYSTARLYLLDNTITSVSDPVFTEDYKTTMTQNQTNSNLVLSIDAIQQNIAEYTVTNSLGKFCSQSVILNLEQGQNNFEINISNLNSGIYFLNLKIEQNTANYKFMVVR